MATSGPVTLRRLVGSMQIKAATSNAKRAVVDGSKLKPGETLIPGKNSSCVAFGSGFIIAHVINVDGKTTVFASHPLARHTKKPKERVKGHGIKSGTTLILQAQREGAKGIVTYDLIIQL